MINWLRILPVHQTSLIPRIPRIILSLILQNARLNHLPDRAQDPRAPNTMITIQMVPQNPKFDRDLSLNLRDQVQDHALNRGPSLVLNQIQGPNPGQAPEKEKKNLGQDPGRTLNRGPGLVPNQIQGLNPGQGLDLSLFLNRITKEREEMEKKLSIWRRIMIMLLKVKRKNNQMITLKIVDCIFYYDAVSVNSSTMMIALMKSLWTIMGKTFQTLLKNMRSLPKKIFF